MKNKILELLESKGDLPPLPDVFIKLLAKLKDPEVTFSEIATLIEYDPVIAGRIIKMSNSAFYRAGNKNIKSLPLAMVTIGLNQISKIVLSLELIKIFDESSITKINEFWQHSLAVAIFTQALSKRTGDSKDVQDLAYISGLMHDLGIMVFVNLIPEEYNKFLKSLKENDEPLEEQENRNFGIDHAELGAVFMEKYWEMDSDIVISVRNHHIPFAGNETEKRTSQLINVADGICNSFGISNSIECFFEVFKEGAWEALGLSLNDVKKLIEDVRSSLGQAQLLIKQS